MSEHVYAKRPAMLQQQRQAPSLSGLSGGPAIECVRCGAVSVDGCGPKGPCPGKPNAIVDTQPTGYLLYPQQRQSDFVLIMETLVELIDWAGPPNMRGRLLDGMQVELERRVAAAKAGAP